MFNLTYIADYEFPMNLTSFMFTFMKDVVRKTYNEMKKQREDFTGFVTDVRLGTLLVLFYFHVYC